MRHRVIMETKKLEKIWDTSTLSNTKVENDHDDKVLLVEETV